MSGGPWGEATAFIVAVYGLTALSFGVVAVLSLLDLRRWSRRARELESKQPKP